jgi:SsrA-binding protein
MTKQRHVDNKKAQFDYEIGETFEAGLVLLGSEIKAFRAGQASIQAAFVRPLGDELWLINSHFTKTPEPDRTRKLLAHRKEIDRYLGKVAEKGLTLVPLELYIKRGRVKVLVGLGKGKKQFEKREAIKKRDVDREIRRGLK